MGIDSIVNNINKINLNTTKLDTNSIDNENKSSSFKDVLKNFVGDVNKMQLEADDKVNRLATGEITNIHDVMVKVEEANLSFSLMMEIRNKIVEGYKEILKTNV